jgi:hypothetical protein
MIRKLLFCGIWLTAMTTLFPRAAHSTNPPVESIVREVQRAELARAAAVRDMVYLAETQVVEWEDASRQAVKSEILSLRRVYSGEHGQLHNEYLSMTVDGRTLDRKEMERELAKQRRGGRGGRGEGERDYRSPFSAEAAPLYDFQIEGQELLEGQPVWVVGFAPKQAEENSFLGSAWISQTDYQPLYVEMAPAVLPRVLEELAMSIRFAAVDGFRLPSVFRMEMRVRVNFLVTLADRTLSIEDRYSGYRLNVGVNDEVFAGDDYSVE